MGSDRSWSPVRPRPARRRRCVVEQAPADAGEVDHGDHVVASFGDYGTVELWFT